VVVVGLVQSWTVNVNSNVTVSEYRPVNITCTTDYTGPSVTFKWTSRSHPEFQQTGQSLWIAMATADNAGSYECLVETDRSERKWAPMHLTVLC